MGSIIEWKDEWGIGIFFFGLCIWRVSEGKERAEMQREINT